MKKADLLLILIFLIAGLSLFSLNAFSKESGNTVKITLNGKLFGTYPLKINRDINIESNGHKNTVTIKDGKVFMSYSDCDGKDCVRSGKVSKAGVPIICLPNGVVVILEGGELDAVAY